LWFSFRGLTKTYRDCRDGAGAVVSETDATVSLRNYRLFGKTVNGGPKFQYPLHSNHNTMTITLTPNLKSLTPTLTLTLTDTIGLWNGY